MGKREAASWVQPVGVGVLTSQLLQELRTTPNVLSAGGLIAWESCWSSAAPRGAKSQLPRSKKTGEDPA